MKRNNDSGDASVFRDRLRKLLGDMTTTEFANKVGVSRQTMGFYLNGDRIPDALTLLQICKACNVSAGWLLGQTEDPAVCPSAVDELGLSVDAILGLTEYSVKQKALLSRLLTTKLFSQMLNSMQHYLSLSENRHLMDVMDLLREQIDAEEIEIALEGELAEKHPEMVGHFFVLYGVNYVDLVKNRLDDEFSVLLSVLSRTENESFEV